MNDIRRKCNPIVNLSKFTSNKKVFFFLFRVNYNILLTPQLESFSPRPQALKKKKKKLHPNKIEKLTKIHGHKSNFLSLKKSTFAASLHFWPNWVDTNVGLARFDFPHPWLFSLLYYHPNNGKDSLSLLFHSIPLTPNTLSISCKLFHPNNHKH